MLRPGGTQWSPLACYPRSFSSCSRFCPAPPGDCTSELHPHTPYPQYNLLPLVTPLSVAQPWEDRPREEAHASPGSEPGYLIRTFWALVSEAQTGAGEALKGQVPVTLWLLTPWKRVWPEKAVLKPRLRIGPPFPWVYDGTDQAHRKADAPSKGGSWT